MTYWIVGAALWLAAVVACCALVRQLKEDL
jgi:hypothetical protein